MSKVADQLLSCHNVSVLNLVSLQQLNQLLWHLYGAEDVEQLDIASTQLLSIRVTVLHSQHCFVQDSLHTIADAHQCCLFFLLILLCPHDIRQTVERRQLCYLDADQMCSKFSWFQSRCGLWDVSCPLYSSVPPSLVKMLCSSISFLHCLSFCDDYCTPLLLPFILMSSNISFIFIFTVAEDIKAGHDGCGQIIEMHLKVLNLLLLSSEGL